MRVVVVAVSTALLVFALAMQATPSAAQKGKGGRKGSRDAPPAKKVDDKDYKAALDRIPDGGKTDPWRKMR